MAGPSKNAKLGSDKKVVAVHLTKRVCACPCAARIPANVVQAVQSTVMREHGQANCRMIYYIKGHETRAAA